MKILFLVEEPADGMSPASRFRVLNFIPYFEQAGIECKVSISSPPKYILGRIKWRRIFEKSILHKIVLAITAAFLMILNRLKDLLICRRYDVVFIQRDLIFIPCYPFLEKLFVIFHPRVVFDFDDAIYTLQSSKKFESLQEKFLLSVLALFGSKNKISNIIKWSKHVIAANDHLYNYALNFKERAKLTVIPTPIDTDKYSLKDFSQKENVLIGWSGQQANLPYLMELKPILEAIGKKYPNVKLKIICNPTLFKIDFKNIPFEFQTWNLDTEVEDLKNIDIGLMPLPEDEWTKGKCSLKLLQYMALGIQ